MKIKKPRLLLTLVFGSFIAYLVTDYELSQKRYLEEESLPNRFVHLDEKVLSTSCLSRAGEIIVIKLEVWGKVYLGKNLVDWDCQNRGYEEATVFDGTVVNRGFERQTEVVDWNFNGQQIQDFSNWEIESNKESKLITYGNVVGLFVFWLYLLLLFSPKMIRRRQEKLASQGKALKRE